MRDQLLVRIDVAAALHRRGLCPAEGLGIPDQHDGERTGCELLQYCGVDVGQREMGHAGRQVADHAYASGFTAQQGDEDRGHGRDHEGRGYAGRSVAEELHRCEAQQTGQHRAKRSVR